MNSSRYGEDARDEQAREKTQRLSKYEADPERPASQDAAVSPGMDFYSPFGPLLAKVTIAQPLIEQINAYADGMVVAGEGREFVVPESVVGQGGDASLAQQVGRLISRYVSHVDNSPVRQVSFDVFWIVSQFAATPSPVHFHSGDISGVLYLKVPEIADQQQEELRTYISGRQAGYINFIAGGKQAFSKSLISFKPHVGELYIFPGWLLHGAEPFRGTGERRSLAFNAFVQ